MIVTRAPLRIPIAGGGTDIPEFYEKYGGGLWVSAAIDKYVYVMINRRYDGKIRFSYMQTEFVDKVDDLKHNLAREILRGLLPVGGIEVVTVADAPSRAGLGSSGAFGVALLSALYCMTNNDTHLPLQLIAETVFNRERMNSTVGKQDQYSAAFGGIMAYRVNERGDVERDLENSLKYFSNPQYDKFSKLLLFDTNSSRDAGTQISSISDFSKLIRIRELAELFLQGRNLHQTISDHWKEKMKYSSFSDGVKDAIDEVGGSGKVIGAGGSGFILVNVDRSHGKELTIDIMKRHGFKNVPFSLVEKGVEVVAVR